jgi:hypothetical protein
MQKITEAQIEQACLQFLHYSKFYCVKIKDQVQCRDGKYLKPRPFEVRGVADIFAIKDGISLWIEVKTKTGQQSVHQKLFQKNIEMNGGVYWVVRSVDELKEKLLTVQKI